MFNYRIGIRGSGTLFAYGMHMPKIFGKMVDYHRVRLQVNTAIGCMIKVFFPGCLIGTAVG
jgi:hypothetical protein